MWEDKLSECLIRGWSAVSAAELQGKGSPYSTMFCPQTQVFARKNASQLSIAHYEYIAGARIAHVLREATLFFL